LSFWQKRFNSSLSNTGLGHLLVVYIIWSSTYLAIRIMMTPGSGFSVWTAGSLRMLLAGLILLIFAAAKHYRIRISLNELLFLFITGILLWFIGNGLIMWVEQGANSGFVALVLGSTPIWSAFIESILNHKKPSRMLMGSLLLSFAGIIALVAPSLVQGSTTELGAGLVVLLSAISWAVGSVLQNRFQIKLEAPVIAAYQHLLGGIGFIFMALVNSQTWPQATPSAWLALSYLIIFGSAIGFTSFVSALQLLPISIAMTYAFVNPVLAQILGWWFLKEPLTIWTLIGTTLVIAGVVRVFQDKEQQGRVQETKTRVSA
jgi:drug/metabolite transporter (DMT)-like permease